jgi:hypothetical protein
VGVKDIFQHQGDVSRPMRKNVVKSLSPFFRNELFEKLQQAV